MKRDTYTRTLRLVLAGIVCASLLAVAPRAQSAKASLKVGVTLHPYYSWTSNIVAGTDVEVRSILPGDVDAGNYQPRPDDIKKLADLDAIVVNGVGHDDFIFDMIRASGNEKIVIVRPNDSVPLIRAANGGTVNSHTFLSFTNAIQQTYTIQKALSALRPDLADRFRENAAAYAKRLRVQKAKAAKQLAEAKVVRVVTVHDGYSYLMQEFGIEIAGVVEPSHGLVPSATELQKMVDLIKQEKVRVVFSEESFPQPLLEVLKNEGGARVYVISHIASGEYTAGKFEDEMQKDVDAMIQALVTDENGD
jgi:zinc transport system substrate-binding protein